MRKHELLTEAERLGPTGFQSRNQPRVKVAYEAVWNVSLQIASCRGATVPCVLEAQGMIAPVHRLPASP